MWVLLARVNSWIKRHRGAALALGLCAAAALLWFLLSRAATRVSVARIERRETIHTVVTSGWVRPQRIQLAAFQSGSVTEVLAGEGEQVEAGQVLLRFDSREAEAAVAEAQANLERVRAGLSQQRTITRREAEELKEQALARLADAERELRRMRDLYAAGVVSREDVDRAETTHRVAESAHRSAEAQLRGVTSGGPSVRQAQATVQQAEAALSLAQTRLRYGAVVAPADGVIIRRGVEVGDTVEAGMTVLELSVASGTELVVEPDERNLALLKVGQPAIASAEAYPDDTFKAEVSFIAPAVDRRRGTIEVRLRVPDPPEYLLPDMTVSVDIEVGRVDSARVLPAAAVRDLASRPWVLVVDDGRARRRAVAVGIHSGDWVEIRTGIEDGDRAILDPDIAEGARVRAARED